MLTITERTLHQKMEEQVKSHFKMVALMELKGVKQEV